MESVASIAPLAGIVILIIGVIAAVYGLLFSSIEIKRIVSLVGLLFFCGMFLVLLERVTQLEFPGILAKITLEAKQDAKTIRSIREGMETQQQAVNALVNELKQTSARVSKLSTEMEANVEKQAADLIRVRISYLTELISLLQSELDEIRWKRVYSASDVNNMRGAELSSTIDAHRKELEALEGRLEEDGNSTREEN